MLPSTPTDALPNYKKDISKTLDKLGALDLADRITCHFGTSSISSKSLSLV
jgi:hypothetical protein